MLGDTSPDTLFIRITIAIGFSALSLLPAVLFDLCLERRHRPLVQGGYALSGLATVLHIAEVFRANASYHRWAMISITIGFGILTLIAAVFVYREEHDRATTSRVVGTMSLFLLAMSFVHLGSGHARQIWSHELAFHHAAIPLALLVLLQDYRFVLLDAFFPVFGERLSGGRLRVRSSGGLAPGASAGRRYSVSHRAAAGRRVSPAGAVRSGARRCPARPHPV